MSTGRICLLCQQECVGGPLVKDSRERVFHKDCYQRAVQRQKESQRQAAAANPPVVAAGPQFKLGDQVACSNGQCAARFVISDPRATTVARLLCPRCKSPVTLAPPVRIAPVAAPAHSDLTSLFDEEFSDRTRSVERVQLLQFLEQEDLGATLAPGKVALKQALLRQCRQQAPLSCPKCDAATAPDAMGCAACGLHFVTAKIAKIAKPKHPSLERAQLEYAQQAAAAAAVVAVAGEATLGQEIAGEVAGEILGAIIEGLLGG